VDGSSYSINADSDTRRWTGEEVVERLVANLPWSRAFSRELQELCKGDVTAFSHYVFIEVPDQRANVCELFCT
jgi:hypothetical protein